MNFRYSVVIVDDDPLVRRPVRNACHAPQLEALTPGQRPRSVKLVESLKPDLVR